MKGLKGFIIGVLAIISVIYISALFGFVENSVLICVSGNASLYVLVIWRVYDHLLAVAEKNNEDL